MQRFDASRCLLLLQIRSQVWRAPVAHRETGVCLLNEKERDRARFIKNRSQNHWMLSAILSDVMFYQRSFGKKSRDF